jgi:hypothetical protein
MHVSIQILNALCSVSSTDADIGLIIFYFLIKIGKLKRIIY